MKTGFPILIFLFFLGIAACNQVRQEPTHARIYDGQLYTSYSNLSNQYLNFDSPKAINHVAKIENHYFRNYKNGVSPFYGTVWREEVEQDSLAGLGMTRWDAYRMSLNEKGMVPDSMHCTIYSVEALEAGMGADFARLEKRHRHIWKDREHAGWSISYLLVKEFGWKAYLFIDSSSVEFEKCMFSWKTSQSYPVWKQPNIPLEGLFVKGQNDALVLNFLRENEFGWGFSYQGWHTWITRFDQLKECNWLGAPCQKFSGRGDFGNLFLFNKTPFMEYDCYLSHIITFPPKQKQATGH